jgi:SET domain-containing protein
MPVLPSVAQYVRPRTSKPKAAIYVRRVRGMGRGVFAGRRFRPGEIIEVCPVIPLPRGQTRACVGDLLDRYVFRWPRSGYPSAVVLGLGSLYNHAADPNARYTPRPEADVMVFRAARPIAPGEQIFVDYEWPARDYHFAVGESARR